MRVREAMMTANQVCHPEDTLADATASIWKSDCNSIPVIDWEDRMLGQISDLDVQAALDRTDRAATEVQVSEAVSHDVVTCSPDDDIHDGLRLLHKSGSKWLPVIDHDRKLLGIFTLDVLLERRKASGDDMGVSESELLKFSYGDL
jgi:CBS-domain-containing membrane protein